MRILGIDPGEVRLGLAVSDELGLTAQALATWTRRGRSADFAHFRLAACDFLAAAVFGSFNPKESTNMISPSLNLRESAIKRALARIFLGSTWL